MFLHQAEVNSITTVGAIEVHIVAGTRVHQPHMFTISAVEGVFGCHNGKHPGEIKVVVTPSRIPLG